MKIQKSVLAQKLNKIKGVVPKKPMLPVLQGVLVRDGYLIANNTEMTVKAKIDGSEGENFIIPERAFDLINNLPDGEVDITASDKNVITIKANKIKNKYQAQDPGQFPVTTSYEGSGEMTIEADTFLESMKRVSYAVPAQGSYATMSAMCLHAGGGALDFVGLDGHVLAWDKVSYDGEFELLIPKNTVERLKSLGISGDIQIKHSKESAVFITKEFEVYTRLVNGNYFNYQAMFRDQPLHTIVERMELLEAMIRAKMCMEGKCPVRFDIQGKVLDLKMNGKTTEYQETVYLQEEIPEKLAIGFDAGLVQETLKAFSCDRVKISLDTPKMPMIIEAEDSNFKAIVLPVLIQ